MVYLMAIPITSNIHTIRISKKVTATISERNCEIPGTLNEN